LIQISKVSGLHRPLRASAWIKAFQAGLGEAAENPVARPVHRPRY
jgi:hypothetical protein